MIKEFMKLSLNQRITISLSILAILASIASIIVSLCSVKYTRESVQEQKNANISSRQTACKADFRDFASSARKEYYSLLLRVGLYENSKQSFQRQEFLNSAASLINQYNSTIQSAVFYKCDNQQLAYELKEIVNIKRDLLDGKKVKTDRLVQYREELPNLQNQLNVCCTQIKE